MITRSVVIWRPLVAHLQPPRHMPVPSFQNTLITFLSTPNLHKQSPVRGHDREEHYREHLYPCCGLLWKLEK